MMYVHPRKLARSVAHNQFKLLGFDNVDKKFPFRGGIAPSYFSTHWYKQIRDYTIVWDMKNKCPEVVKKCRVSL